MEFSKVTLIEFLGVSITVEFDKIFSSKQIKFPGTS